MAILVSHYIKEKKTSEHQLAEVRSHIGKFPCVDSHYVRSDSQKQYLEASLNLTKMSKLYCQQNSINPVTFNICIQKYIQY